MNQIQPIGRAPQGADHQNDQASEIRLNEALTILWRRKWLLLTVTAVCMAVAVAAYHKAPKRWRAEAQMVLVQRVPNSEAPSQSADAPEETPDTQLGMIRSQAMAERAIGWLKNNAYAKGLPTSSVTITPEELAPAVKVSNPEDTNLLNISVEANDHDQAKSLADAVCQAFIQWKKDLARQDVQLTEESLQVRADQARQQMLSAEDLATDYKKIHNLVDVSIQEKAILEQVAARDTDVANLQQALSAEQARLAALGAQLQSENAAIKNGKGVRDDTLVLDLQTQLNQAEIDRANAALKYTPKYPGILPELDGKISDLKKRLGEAVRSTLDNQKPSLQAQGALLANYKQAQIEVIFGRAQLAGSIAARNQVKQQEQTLPQTEMEYARLARNADLATQLYITLQSNLNAARVDQDKINGNVQLTQAAIVPDAPFSPNLTVNLLLGAALGVFLSLILIVIREQTDRLVDDMDDVRRLGPLPVIGALPRLPQTQMKTLAHGERLAVVTEACHLTLANLNLLMHQISHRQIWPHGLVLVTSALPREGVSMTALQLARAIASTGKRTILVDANMRKADGRGEIRKKVMPEVDCQPGLSEVVSGDLSLSEVILTTDMENLCRVSSGRNLGDAAVLFSSPMMSATLSDLRTHADIVIVDAPSCVGHADTIFLAPQADCIIQVACLGRVDAESLLVTHEALRAACPNTALLLNRTRSVNAGAFRSAPPRSLPPQYHAQNGSHSQNGTHAPNGRYLPNGPYAPNGSHANGHGNNGSLDKETIVNPVLSSRTLIMTRGAHGLEIGEKD